MEDNEVAGEVPAEAEEEEEDVGARMEVCFTVDVDHRRSADSLFPSFIVKVGAAADVEAMTVGAAVAMAEIEEEVVGAKEVEDTVADKAVVNAEDTRVSEILILFASIAHLFREITQPTTNSICTCVDDIRAMAYHN